MILEPDDIGYDTEFLISGLYLGFFGRAGEPAGYNYWYREIALNGLSNVDAATLFAKSDEFRQAFSEMPGMSAASSLRFVEILYGNILERVPDATGQSYWLNKVIQSNGDPAAIGLIVVQFIDAVRSPLNDYETMIRDGNTFGAKHVAAFTFRALLQSADVDGAGPDGQLDPQFLAIARDVVDEEVTGATLNTHDSFQETIAFLKIIGADPGLPES